MPYLRSISITLVALAIGLPSFAQDFTPTSYKGKGVYGDDWELGHSGHYGHGLRHSGPFEDPCQGCPSTGMIPNLAHRHPPEPLKAAGPARWIVRGEIISFQRFAEDDQPIVFRVVDDEELFTFADFPFEEEVGYRGVAQVNLGPRFGVEVVYTRLHDEFSEEVEVDDGLMPDVEPIELRAAENIVNSPTEPLDLRYSTRFQSGELNAKYYVDHWTTAIFGGFRWVELDERFYGGILNNPVGFDPPLIVDTKNQLLGLQMGIESQHWIGYGVARLDSSLRGGVFRNKAEQLSRGGGTQAFAQDRDYAWVGESEIRLTVPVNRNGSFFISYRLIHMAGLALAADQINVTDLPASNAGIYQDGQTIFHGWSAGFEAWR